MSMAEDAFAKVENLRSQHPKESNTALCKRAGVTTVSFYAGRRATKGGDTKKRAAPAAQASVKARRGRKPGSANKTSVANGTTSAPARTSTTTRGDELVALIGSPSQIRDFLSGQFA